MGLNSGDWSGNAAQLDFRVPLSPLTEDRPAKLNPLEITDSSRPPNYLQTDYRDPDTSPLVATYPVGTNVLLLSWPIPRYNQP